MIHFQKYHGTGNDFILVDDREEKFFLDTEQIKKLCDRHFGIGADGLILLRKQKGFNFKMIYYNADGMEGSMCGNGGRCAVAFAHSLGLTEGEVFFTAYDGGHKAEIISVEPYVIRLHMKDVHKLEIGKDFVFLNTGSPHYCIFVHDADKVDVLKEGRKIRYSDLFAEQGTNVNFIEPANDVLKIRTYERGVENETLSCGTGVTAAVLAASVSGRISGNECTVITPGGALKVNFIPQADGFSGIWLEGPATPVFKGQLII